MGSRGELSAISLATGYLQPNEQGGIDLHFAEGSELNHLMQVSIVDGIDFS